MVIVVGVIWGDDDCDFPVVATYETMVGWVGFMVVVF